MTGHPLTLQTFGELWTVFFYSPQSPLSLAVFRICFGTVLFIESLGLLRYGKELYGSDGLRYLGHPSNRRTDATTAWIFRVHTLSCLAVAVGFMTRVAAVFVFLNFCFRMRRNWMAGQGGDNVAKFMSFLLIFSNAGGVLSIDHLLHWHYLGGVAGSASQWAMRLMQIQVSIIYLRTVLWKIRATEWLDGSAVFHAMDRNINLRKTLFVRVVFNWLRWAPLAAVLTWFTLGAETFIGIFVWFRETRNAALGVALLTHLGYEAFLSIKQFQWLMLSSLLLFISPQEWISFTTTLRGAWH